MNTLKECRELIHNANYQMWLYRNEGMKKDEPVFQELLNSKRKTMIRLKELKND